MLPDPAHIILFTAALLGAHCFGISYALPSGESIVDLFLDYEHTPKDLLSPQPKKNRILQPFFRLSFMEFLEYKTD